MKQELDTILRHLDYDDEEILNLRDSILGLDTSQHDEIENLIRYLYNSTIQANIKSHDYLGYYYFFLGCVYYEKGDYPNVIKSLGSTTSQLWEAQTNKALAYWLLGISYSHLNDYPKARDALQEALDILSTNRRINALSAQKQYKQRAPIIEKINNTLISLQTGTPNLHKVLAEIISQLKIPEGGLNPYWQDWQESIHGMEPDPSHVLKQIDNLMGILNLETPDTLIGTPFINIFLAHCYNLEYFSGNEESLSSAIEYAEKAIIGFSANNFNQALSHWYAALLCSNLSDTEAYQSHIENADYLLDTLLETTKYTSIDFYNDIQNAKNSLWFWVNKFKQINRVVHYAVPTNQVEPEKRLNFFRKENKKQPESASAPELTKNSLSSKNKQTTKESSKPEPENKSNIRHIIVPVDISALNDQQTKATPLSHVLFNKLESYNRPDTVSQKSAFHHDEVPAEKHIVVPIVSIYGDVSTGPNGEALLNISDILGQSSEVYENMRVQIEEREYEIKFINSPNHIFQKSKVYGWLKVTGESMNKTLPYPILTNDYVLFCENHNFESCARKIVIALVSELEGYPPRTMIKRLIKMSGETVHQEDGYDSELHKFMLHSESYDESFKKDIEIEHEYQITGEVIVIAKLI